MKSYMQMPVLWVTLLNLLMSLLINIDVLHAVSINPLKLVYGVLYLTVGILGASAAATFHSLVKRIAALEARIEGLATSE